MASKGKKQNIMDIKKILLIVTLMFIIGCGDNIKVVSKSDITKSIIIDGRDRYIVSGSDGHEYLENKNSYVTIFNHYIECDKCSIKKDTLTAEK